MDLWFCAQVVTINRMPWLGDKKGALCKIPFGENEPIAWLWRSCSLWELLAVAKKNKYLGAVANLLSTNYSTSSTNQLQLQDKIKEENMKFQCTALGGSACKGKSLEWFYPGSLALGTPKLGEMWKSGTFSHWDRIFPLSGPVPLQTNLPAAFRNQLCMYGEGKGWENNPHPK